MGSKRLALHVLILVVKEALCAANKVRFLNKCSVETIKILPAHKKDSLKTMFPRLKSFVVRPRSFRKLSEFAWDILLRSNSSAKNIMKVQSMILKSIFRTIL